MKKIIEDDPVLSHADVKIASAATSYEETGNDMYPAAKAKLREKGIPFSKRRARTLTKNDYETYDLLIGMDDANIRNLCRMYGEQRRTDDPEKRMAEGSKIYGLAEFYGSRKPIADPWYTDDFETAYRQIEEGCQSLKELLRKQCF